MFHLYTDGGEEWLRKRGGPGVEAKGVWSKKKREERGRRMDIGQPTHFVDSHSKSFEFLIVLLTQCGGTNFKALTIFPFPQIGHLPFT